MENYCNLSGLQMIQFQFNTTGLYKREVRQAGNNYCQHDLHYQGHTQIQSIKRGNHSSMTIISENQHYK